ncbi:MAG: hypothetical protein H3C64_07120 [Candidatus Kuenenia stuttgartiensis]|nr:hypothetical protein [Candidatus Kuenenia stuttgartiensis]
MRITPEHININDLYRPNETGVYMKGEAARMAYLALRGLEKLQLAAPGSYTVQAFANMLSELDGDKVEVKTAGKILNAIRLYGKKSGLFDVRVDVKRIGPKLVPAMMYRIITKK